MRAVLPAHPAGVYQPQISFVDQVRGLQRVAGAFAPQIAPRQPVQFAIDQRGQLSSAPLSPSFQASNSPVISCAEGLAIYPSFL